MNNKKMLLIGAAFAGIAFANADKTTTAPAAKPAAEEKVKCYGVNACKGKGTCAGKVDSCNGKNGCEATSSCSGANACKGKGIEMMTKEACTAKGGKVAV